MSDKMRIGILGGGGILNAHAPGFQNMKDVATVVAVAEPNPAQHERLQKLFGPDLEIYPDYQDLLDKADVDAVDILLPHDLHAPATVSAAKTGKHVLVEKVMARNIEECDQMIDACEEAGVSLTVCHDRRYSPQWIALKEIVESSVLGTPFFWKLDHNQDVAPRDRNSWISSRERLGGGAIMSCLTHQIDALRWYDGELASVTCMTKTLPERMEGETAGVILAQMRSGALAQLSINWFTRSHRANSNELWYEMVQVCGDKGEAYMINNRGVFLRLHDRDESEWSKRYGDEIFEGFVQIECENGLGHPICVKEWINSIIGEPANVTTSGRECRGTVEVAQASYISENEGRVIELPLNN